MTDNHHSPIVEGRLPVTGGFDDLLQRARHADRELARTSVEYRRILTNRETGEICAKCGCQLEHGQTVWYVELPTGRNSLYNGRPILLDVTICTDCLVVPKWWIDNESSADFQCAAFPPSFARSCPVCDRRIRYRNARYRLGVCSKRCARAEDARRKREERAWAQLYRSRITCDECGTSFKPKRADARYCNPACRQKAYRERNRDG